MNYEEKKPMHEEEKTEKKPSYGAQPEGKKPKEAAPKGEEQKKSPMQGNGEALIDMKLELVGHV